MAMAGERRNTEKRQSRGKDKDLNQDREVAPIQVSARRWRNINQAYAKEKTDVFWNVFSPPQPNRLGEGDIPSQSQSSQSSSSQHSSQFALNQISPSVLLGTVNNKRTPPPGLMKRKTKNDSKNNMIRHGSSEQLMSKYSGLFPDESKRSKKTAAPKVASLSRTEPTQTSVSTKGQGLAVAKSVPASHTLTDYVFPEDDIDDGFDDLMMEATQAAEENHKLNNNNHITCSKNKSTFSSAEIQETPKRSSSRVSTRKSQNFVSGGQRRRTSSCNDLDDHCNQSVFETSTTSPGNYQVSQPQNMCLSDPGSTTVPPKIVGMGKKRESNEGVPQRVSTIDLSPADELDDGLDDIFSQINLP